MLWQRDVARLEVVGDRVGDVLTLVAVEREHRRQPPLPFTHPSNTIIVDRFSPLGMLAKRIIYCYRDRWWGPAASVVNVRLVFSIQLMTNVR